MMNNVGSQQHIKRIIDDFLLLDNRLGSHPHIKFYQILRGSILTEEQLLRLKHYMMVYKESVDTASPSKGLVGNGVGVVLVNKELGGALVLESVTGEVDWRHLVGAL